MLGTFSVRKTQETALRALYRGAFGKEASDSFIRNQFIAMESGVSFDEVIERFFRTGTYQAHIARRAQQESRAIYRLDLTEDPETLSQLYEKTATYWRNEGSKAEEIYYSVVSSTSNRKLLSSDERRVFFNSGEHFIRLCEGICTEFLKRPISQATALDFGCGVGRLSVHAAKRFKNVVSVDFSRNHLNELSRNIDEFFPDLKLRVKTYEISGLADMENLPKTDFVYSLIVLQHNTPPVMARLLQRLLVSLKRKGVAAIQVPLYIPYYVFSSTNYLADPKAGSAMEMHILPKENMRDIAKSAGCTMVDSFGMGSSKPYSELVVFKKP